MSQKRPQAVATVQVDNERVKVTEWRFAPGAETGWHRHGMDYVITTITPCRMLIEEPGGASREAEMASGFAYRRNAGVEHNVVNIGRAVGIGFAPIPDSLSLATRRTFPGHSYSKCWIGC